jgi:hypothetical protein
VSGSQPIIRGVGNIPDDREDHRGVHVDEQTSDFVEGMEDEGVTPCDNSASQWACPSDLIATIQTTQYTYPKSKDNIR